MSAYSAIQNAMRLQALRASSWRTETRVGIVQNYNQNNYSVKVSLLPDGILTGNIPLAALWVGNGWGMYCAPSIGDQVSVSFFEGSSEAAYAELRFYNNLNRP